MAQHVSLAWAAYTAAVGSDPPKQPSSSHLQTLCSASRGRSLTLWTFRTLLHTLSRLIPTHLRAASLVSSSSPSNVSDSIASAHRHFSEALSILSSLQAATSSQSLCTRFVHRLRANLLPHLPAALPNAVYKFFRHYLLRLEQQQPVVRTSGPQLCLHLSDLGFPLVAEHALSCAVFERLDALVHMRISPSSRAIPLLLHWVRHHASPIVASLLPPARSTIESQRWLKRLVFHLHETVCTIRTSQLLLLINQFPHSIPALQDLRDCLLCTDRKPFVAIQLRQQFVDVLLNAGTTTDHILQQYVHTIRTLRFLDPTGTILHCVSGPIHEYLRKRPDTVRCIVSGMTGDGELYEELRRGRGGDNGDNIQGANNAATIVPTTGKDDEDDDCESIDGDFNAGLVVDAGRYEAWRPEARDAPMRDGGRAGRGGSGGDAIGTLVAIYGSSEEIVGEYRGLLADKLVSSFDVDLEREEGILELLTERFGKEAMHSCWIMVKDVHDSGEALEGARRMRDGELLVGFEATVISKEFWPKLADEGAFKGSAQVEGQMRKFEEGFRKMKKPRKLRWEYGVGSVQVRVEFEDGRTVEANVTPMQARILGLFTEDSRLTVTEVAQRIAAKDVGNVRRKMQGLANMGFVRARMGTREEFETVEDGGGNEGLEEEEEEEGEGAAADEEDDAQDAEEDREMAVYETYIMGMLTNLKQLSLEQVHNMLQRFVQTPVYDKTQAQLAAFLAKLVDKGKVSLAGGLYRVNSSNNSDSKNSQP